MLSFQMHLNVGERAATCGTPKMPRCGAAIENHKSSFGIHTSEVLDVQIVNIAHSNNLELTQRSA